MKNLLGENLIVKNCCIVLFCRFNFITSPPDFCLYLKFCGLKNILKLKMEVENMSRFNQTLQEFDAVNAQDPHTETVDGKEVPKELLYSQRMSAMLKEFYPKASETLQLAARCQHIKRWTIPREDFTLDRKG